MALNTIQKAMVEVGLIEEPQSRKHKKKKFKCKVCGAPMQTIDETNIMVCTGDKCKNYYLFNNK